MRAALTAAVLMAGICPGAGCDRDQPPPAARVKAAPVQPACDPDNGGLILPEGFCALVVADHFANLRDLTAGPGGDLYGALLNRRIGYGGLVALRDTDGDGRADEIRQFGEQGGVGIGIHQGYLYLGTDTAIVRYRLDGGLVPQAPPEEVVGGFPQSPEHASKTFAFGADGHLYVSVGAPSNACQAQDRSPGSPGLDPCPELSQSGGIWRFDPNRIGQRMADAERFGSGIRHALAIAWQPQANELYVVQHGRDQLNEMWPQKFTAEQSDLLPAEEMLRVTPGAVFGWPYCYYDPFQQRHVLAPEYGGDGMRVDRCSSYPAPVVAFPAHYGPNDALFYAGSQFPERFRGGAFIAFHGAYKRMAEGQIGYQVVFVPFARGQAGGQWEVFAEGFAGPGAVAGPEETQHRPTGLAEGPDGSLYVGDSVSGRIWRILYRGAPGATGSGANLPRNPGSKDGSR